MKKTLTIIFTLISLFYLPIASSGSAFKVTAFHRGYTGITKLTNQTLFLQITPNDHFYVDTNSKAGFELSSAYAGKEMRAYLVHKIGDEQTVVAGCFSAFVPVESGEVSLKGVSCLGQ